MRWRPEVVVFVRWPAPAAASAASQAVGRGLRKALGTGGPGGPAASRGRCGGSCRTPVGRNPGGPRPQPLIGLAPRRPPTNRPGTL